MRWAPHRSGRLKRLGRHARSTTHLINAPGMQIFMRVDEQCKFLCSLPLDAARAKAFQTRVEESYRVNMCVAMPLLPFARATNCARRVRQSHAGVGLHLRRRTCVRQPTSCFAVVHTSQACSVAAPRLVQDS